MSTTTPAASLDLSAIPAEAWIHIPLNYSDRANTIIHNLVYNLSNNNGLIFISANVVDVNGNPIGGISIPLANFRDLEIEQRLRESRLTDFTLVPSRDPNVIIMHYAYTPTIRRSAPITPAASTAEMIREATDVIEAPVLPTIPDPLERSLDAEAPSMPVIPILLPDEEEERDPDYENEEDESEPMPEDNLYPRVTVLSLSHMEALDVIVPILQEFAEKYDINIWTRNWHSAEIRKDEEPSPDDSNVVRVYFWTNIRGDSSGGKTYDSINDLVIAEGQYDGWKPSSTSEAIHIKDTHGRIIAEYKDNTLCILMDLPHNSNSVVEPVLRYILEQYFAFTGGKVIKEPLTEEEIKKKEEEKKLRQQKYLLDLIKMKHTSSISKINATINEHQSRVKDYESGISGSLRAIVESEEMLEVMKSKKTMTSEILDREIKLISELEDVVGVEISKNIIRIKTRLINFTHKNVLRKGHEFIIDLIVNNSLTAIKVSSLDSSSIPTHPHVSSTGSPCLGNLKLPIAKLLSTDEFYIAAQMIIEYLKTANDGDWYYDPLRWSEA